MDNENEKIVLIDTDAGTDDALAIFMAIAAHKDPSKKFTIVAITCVNGNTTVENVVVNVTRVLQAADATEIPVFSGCANPMVIPYILDSHVPPFHGYDGFGDVDSLPSIETRVEPENGVLALIRLAKLYKEKLTIVALGPLTNLAMAVRLDPSIKECVKNIYLMGGNSAGVGNTTFCGEFNFVVDPEAAHVTLASFPCPIVIVPWELCKSQGSKLKNFRIDTMAQLDTPQVNLLNAVEVTKLSNRLWFPCDSLACAVLIEPNVIGTVQDLHASVELSGLFARGLMAIDHADKFGRRKNVRVVFSIDDELLKKLLLWAVGGDKH